MTRSALQVVAIAIAFGGLCSARAGAQDFTSPVQVKGTKDTQVWVGGVAAQHDGTTTFNTEIWMAGACFGKVLTSPHGPGWLRGTLQWDFDLIPVFVITNLQSGYGAEIDPIVGRWNFQHKGRAGPYFEMAGGIALTNTKIPPGDTSKFNVVPKVGIGWQVFRRAQRSIDMSFHAWHLSNAWTAPRNPSANGILLTIGYHWYGQSFLSRHKAGVPSGADQ